DASRALLDGVEVHNTHNAEIQVDTDVSGDPPSKLIIDDGTTISDGTLTIGPVGTLEVASSGATLSGVTVNNSHAIQIDQGATLTLSGTIINHGTIDDRGDIHVTGDSTISDAKACGDVSVDGGVTLTLDGTAFTGGTFSISGTLDTSG